MARPSLALLVALAILASGCTAGNRTMADVESPPPVAGEEVEGTPRPTRSAREPTVRPTPPDTPPPTPASTPAPVFGQAPTGPTQPATVTEVTDGDTIKVSIDGVVHPVRYIGIDTPEVFGGVEFMGREASAANEALVAGQQVVLEKDVSEVDRYGRLLRYVWVAQGGGWLLVNLELLRLGMAQVSTYPPDVKYADALYLPAQREAQAAGIGLWAAPSPTPADLARPPPAAPCDSSYPGVCMAPYPPDLDCGDISFRRFQVVPPDPHGFDGDSDGIGCEG